jgi:endonuclease/exonuclease/phosphatase family metal-dependent hydrolase
MKALILIALFIVSLPTWAGLKMASYNIRNFDYDERAHIPTDKNFLYKTISKINPDFMAVQEIRETQKFEQFINSRFNNRYDTALTECGGAHGQKLGFVFDKSKFSLLSFKDDLRTSNPGQNSYNNCNEGRPKSIQKRFKQLGILGKVVSEYRAQGFKNFVIMGDFNSTEYIFKGNVHNKFKLHVEKMGMQDLAADIPCTAYWWGGMDDGKQHPSMLDHMLVSNEFLNKASVSQAESLTKATTTAHCQNLSCKVTYEDDLGTSFDSVSDHCPIQSEI